ncbi:antigen WC1.1-like [Stylophora pistillata]|uniref:antigen WC1.1-like n=1 Tax=Stylophora pistillata TaxID=50429 RepID=UPI000C051410|nr:antigen WC1.1-like [Stylophora pistillata]
MAGRQALLFTAVIFISEMFRDIASQQCGAGGDLYSIYQMMLKGHTYKTFKTTPGTLECREACLADFRCQSYNVVMFIAICELNNRTKEARPEDFVKEEDRYYMAKGPKRVPLGSTRELPAESCKEIKASEGGQAVSGYYWLDTTRSGNSILARCDMKMGDIDECAMSAMNTCHRKASCINTQGSYNCTCNPGYTGDGLTCAAVDECQMGSYSCPSNGHCFTTVGSYVCKCKPGYYGDIRKNCTATNEDAPIRLTGGGANYGRVEVYYNGTWGTVCDDHWTINEANVVCRQLGFSGASQAKCCAEYGQGSDPIWMDDVYCQGGEAKLSHCTFLGWKIENCRHTEDAGVACNH